jgi:hypothetical protein
VTLFNGSFAQYGREHRYDAAGNRVMARRKNLTVDGIIGPKTWTTLTKSYDAVNNVTALRTQVDANPAQDLIYR